MLDTKNLTEKGHKWDRVLEGGKSKTRGGTEVLQLTTSETAAKTV